jgi:hypothetical protein
MDAREGRRDKLGAGVREANAEIQSGSCFGRSECPSDSDGVLIHRVVGFLKIAAPERNVTSSKSGSDFRPSPASINAPVPNRTSCAIVTLLRRLHIVYLRLS